MTIKTIKNVDTPPVINPSIVLSESFLRLCVPYFLPIKQAAASAPVVINATEAKIGNGVKMKGIKDKTIGVEATKVFNSSGLIDKNQRLAQFGSM